MTELYSARKLPGFPSAEAYKALLNHTKKLVCEATARSFGFSERHLQCVWFDPRLRPTKLTTTNGESVSVIAPGQWNSEAGPDFMDAVLVLGPDRRQVRGDVEIHITPTDWNSHGHADDPRYKKVIAHVTYTPPHTPITTLPPGTIEISLKKALDSMPAFAFDAIDITAYPYSPLPGSPRPCHRALQKISTDNVTALLESAGAHRMQIKADRIATDLQQEPPEQVLYREILGALGYKQNTGAFRLLADRIPYSTVSKLQPLEGYALMLGVANLIPPKLNPRWDAYTKKFIRQVWNAWWPRQEQWQNHIIQKNNWCLSSIRPQNHPIRRLAAAAALFCSQPDPVKQISKLATTIPPEEFSKAISQLFQAPSPIDYWHHHISLASKLRKTPIAIIGKTRSASICINTILPFMAAKGINISKIAASLPPEQNNIIIRRTANALLGPDHNPVIYSKYALRQQGLIQIFYDFCLNNRSACQDCPLITALKKLQ